jgi:hypothetical protein
MDQCRFRGPDIDPSTEDSLQLEALAQLARVALKAMRLVINAGKPMVPQFAKNIDRGSSFG